MLPYLDPKPLQLGALSVQWFGLLVGTGIIIGRILARWRARKLGFDAGKIEAYIL